MLCYVLSWLYDHDLVDLGGVFKHIRQSCFVCTWAIAGVVTANETILNSVGKIGWYQPQQSVIRVHNYWDILYICTQNRTCLYFRIVFSVNFFITIANSQWVSYARFFLIYILYHIIHRLYIYIYIYMDELIHRLFVVKWNNNISMNAKLKFCIAK